MVSTTLTYDDIVNMIHGVGQQYRSLPKVAFAFNNSGIAKVRKIRTTTVVRSRGRFGAWASGSHLRLPGSGTAGSSR